MEVWLDAHLPPALVPWLGERFGLQARSIIDLGLAERKDREIFDRARDADAIMMSKDSDFADLVARLGPPPRVIHLTMGNSSTAELKRVLGTALTTALRLLESGDSLVEIAGGG